MINELLVILANKTTGFSYPSLNVAQPFTPLLDADANEVRHILTNDEEKWALTLVWLLLGDPVASLCVNTNGVWSTDLSDIILPGGTVTNGKLVASGDGPAAITVNTLPMTWPYSTVITAEVVDDHVTRITAGDITRTVRSFVTASKGIWSIEWPEGIGITGNIVPDSLGGGLQPVLIDVPTHYPYGQVKAILRASEAFYRVLSKTDLVDAFYATVDARDAVAAAVLALYKLYHQQIDITN